MFLLFLVNNDMCWSVVTVLGYTALYGFSKWSCFSFNIEGLWIILPVPAWILWFWTEMYTAIMPLSAYVYV